MAFLQASPGETRVDAATTEAPNAPPLELPAVQTSLTTAEANAREMQTAPTMAAPADAPVDAVTAELQQACVEAERRVASFVEANAAALHSTM